VNTPGSIDQGVQGRALSVTSSDQEVDLQADDNAAISLDNTNFTLSGWVNFSAIPEVDQAWLMKGVTGGASDYSFYLRTDGKIVFSFSPDGATTYEVESAQALSPQTWYHVAAVYDGAQVVLYLNAGTPTSLTTIPASWMAPAGLKIGTFAYDNRHYPIR